ncbi:MAG: hypothetical protein NC094_10960 [Bacteroidales bacterium]|nr:hypothetical protein [Lachnoclostridium sp.]MCM1382921.1 hypothetical protein [Lachnoclostridium sp.]MCM1465927.1 hypothetical protein [Bacteroidales bacterium]
MSRIAMRYFLLNKRLFKKLSFIIILCMVPVLVAGIRIAAKGESGIVKIVLCMQNPEEELSAEILEKLMKKDSVFRYSICETPSRAREMVANYEADAAWLFPENLEEELRKSAFAGHIKPVVTVVEREDNASLMLTREVLCNTLYPAFSYAVYENFVRSDLNISETQADDAQLLEVYHQNLIKGSFFQMEYPDGQADEGIDYLLAPVRGILGVWLALCGFTASLYYMQDEQRGTFSKISARNRLWMAFYSHAVLLSDAVVILLLGCGLAGVFTVWHREIFSAVLFACCTVAFSNLLRLICRTPALLGSCIPVALLGMLVMCPVFIGINSWKALRYLFPLYYYLNSIHNPYYLKAMVIYAAVAAVLCILLHWWQTRE